MVDEAVKRSLADKDKVLSHSYQSSSITYAALVGNQRMKSRELPYCMWMIQTKNKLQRRIMGAGVKGE
jgi:hypothetical protein